MFSGVKELSNLIKLFLIIFFDLNNGPNVFPRKQPISDAICKGEYDHLPEAAFYMVGTIEEAIEKAEKIKKDAA